MKSRMGAMASRRGMISRRHASAIAVCPRRVEESGEEPAATKEDGGKEVSDI